MPRSSIWAFLERMMQALIAAIALLVMLSVTNGNAHASAATSERVDWTIAAR